MRIATILPVATVGLRPTTERRFLDVAMTPPTIPRRRPGLRSGPLAHRLLLEEGVDEASLPADELAVRERMFLARNFAYAWLTASLIQFGMLLVPASGRHEAIVALIASGGVLVSIAHFVLYERVPLGSYQVSMIGGWIAAGLDVWSAGDQAIVSVLFFAWIGVYAAATFGLRTLLWQLPLAVTAWTVGLAANESGIDPWYGPFGMATVVTICVLVYAGNVRTHRLFSTVLHEREARERTVRQRQIVAEVGTAALAATSLEELQAEVLARVAAEGYPCTVEVAPGATEPPRPGAYEIPGTGRVLVHHGTAEGGSELLASVGRVIGLAEQRFAVEARRIRLESELADARRLEAIGRLAGGVAHDFNNVLTVIIGNTELALHDLPHDSAADAKLREVLVASRRAAALVAQLLALGSRQLVSVGPVDVGAVVRGLEDILRRLLGEGCTLAVAVEPGTPPCRADRTQVEQIVLNLVANARDAMPAGGATTITVGRAPDPAGVIAHEDGYVVLTVHDTGIGMDDETRRRAFEPFFSSKPFGSGTGLGLSTVHGILNQVGGASAIESAPGRGTTFRAYLPVAVPDEAEAPHAG